MNLENKPYLIAVSGGPDSMALLDMCIKENIKLFVCHVNYRKRKNSDKEMVMVENFCKSRNIDVFILNEDYTYTKNFQAFARDYRYKFFLRISEEVGVNSILVAHHEDDLLETYLMQKEKNLEVDHYGIAYKTQYKNLTLVRPLLKSSKKDLEDYCISNKVPYFIDESNLEDTYTRNRIRHNKLSNLSSKERKKLLDEIDKKNKDKKTLEDTLKPLSSKTSLEYEVFNNLSEKEQLCLLRLWFNRHIGKETYSKAFLKEVIKFIKAESKSSLRVKNKMLIKGYRVCEIVGNYDKDYSFVIESNREITTPYFSIRKQGKKIEGISVRDDEWPLTIRNYRDKDEIKLRFGTKKINRWFIDRKIDKSLRKMWPIVLNNKNEVIMVPGLGCDINHYTINPNIFVIK